MAGHVLLVLSKEEEARVLAEDACGGRPPSAHRGGAQTEWAQGRSMDKENALVLVWHGQVLRAGCDAAARIINSHHYIHLDYDLVCATLMAQWCADGGTGTLLVVANGAEPRVPHQPLETVFEYT